ncbi:MAG: hypothetical protein DRI95_14965 [Bacteroidetes bacterium]|nr:MAG: hypothetical protein DRI95_14965 [Bacteroidota bacterium]
MKQTTNLTPKQVYDLIYLKSQKHVENFRTDYEIDKKTILKFKGNPFIHISRTNGTSLNMFFKLSEYNNPTKKDFLTVVNNIVSTIDHYLTQVEPLCILYYNGNKVTKITPDKARNLFNDYKRSIIYQYENKF